MRERPAVSLPGRLVLPSYGVLGGLLALVVARAYLLVALASRGGLGSGDVKFSGLLGMAMGWQGWSAVVTGTLVTWLGTAAVLLVLRILGRRPSAMPMGPFLLSGTLFALASG
jgi:leader peptidase (prepilin peptidase)/N-methyltransferase